MADSEKKLEGSVTSRAVRGILKDEPQTMTAAGFLARADKQLEFIQQGRFGGEAERPLSEEERCLLRAIISLREACMVMAADIARLKARGKVI